MSERILIEYIYGYRVNEGKFVQGEPRATDNKSHAIQKAAAAVERACYEFEQMGLDDFNIEPMIAERVTRISTGEATVVEP